MDRYERSPVLQIIVTSVAALALLIPGCMWGMPYYWVFHQHMDGKAQLARAEYAKQVMVQDAMARKESSKSLADAEVIRAEGVAKANKIIGGSLENNEAYLHYLWIHNLELGNHDVIYVPTEASIPIFEAGGRFQRPKVTRAEPGQPGTVEHPDAR